MSSFDPLVEAATQRLDLIYNKADALVKRWFPNLPDGPDRRITLLAVMKSLVGLMQIEAGVPATVSAPAIPRLDLADLEELPWQTRDKQPARPGQWAWLFGPESTPGTPEGAEELVKAIEASRDGKLELGEYEYSLSKDRVFIQRRPIKKSSNPHARMQKSIESVKQAAGRMGLK